MRVATIRPQSDRYTASTATFGFGSTFDNKKFRQRCRFAVLSFDLAVEAHKNMKYMMLVYLDEQAMSESEREHCYVESAQLARELSAKGKYVASSPLHPVAMATSVRVR